MLFIQISLVSFELQGNWRRRQYADYTLFGESASASDCNCNFRFFKKKQAGFRPPVVDSPMGQGNAAFY
jgi:hypothetical protein